jgi:hypothetical protein
MSVIQLLTTFSANQNSNFSLKYSTFGFQPTSFDEGSTLTFTAKGTNIFSGYTLYWTILNITTSSEDFSATSGSIVLDLNLDPDVFGPLLPVTNTYYGQFSFGIVSDFLTEGNETFKVQLRQYNIDGPILATIPVGGVTFFGTTPDFYTINDTSTSI